MPMPQQMGGAAAAAGGMPPPPSAPAMTGPGPQMPQTAQPGNASGNVTEVVEALKQILPQCVDERGYVNMDRLITLWPQVSQIPFQVVMQLIQQTPDLLNELVAQYGLNGIIVKGRIISADELASLGGAGASGGA